MLPKIGAKQSAGDFSMMDFLTLVIGLMAWVALGRTKAMALELKAARARLAKLESILAPQASEGVTEAITQAPPAPQPAPPPIPTAVSGPSTNIPVFEWLAGRGLVWVGAVALGLAGVFLIRYSIDNGLFGPLARVIAGVVLGSALITTGEWLERHSLSQPPCPGGTMPTVTSQTALIGSGVTMLFTACYGAYAVYNLIDPLPAFLMLAIIALASLLMALRHGPIIALIGLIGAFAVPALVGGEIDPAALELFLYLAAVVATCLAVVRHKGWWWLGWVALAAAIGWTLIWLASHQEAADTVVTGGFAFFVLLLCPVGLHLSVSEPGAEATRLSTSPPLIFVGTATAGAMLIFFIGLRLEDYGLAALLWLGAAAVFTQWAALRGPDLIPLPWIVGSTTTLGYLAWLFPLPRDSGWIGVAEGQPTGHLPHALFEPDFMPYTLTGFAIALIFGFGSWLGAQRTAKPWPWSLLSVLAPLLVLIIAYSHTASSAIAPPWAATALILAAIFLSATSSLHRRVDYAPVLAVSLATYAAGVVAAVTLSLVMILHDFWLTVAIALQLPALAWIERRTRVPEMRLIALALVVTVLVRLVLNPGIAGYDIGTTLIFNDLLYGYGVPLLAFRVAQLMFQANRKDATAPQSPPGLLADLLEAGWIAFMVLLVSLELRHWVGGGTLIDHQYQALEQGLQVLWWGGLALVLMRADRNRLSPIISAAWKILAVLAFGHVIILGLLAWNPLLHSFSVGVWPLFNLVTLNYGGPALLAALFTLEARRQQSAAPARSHELGPIQTCGGVAAIVLTWVFVTLTVRHAFQGPILAWIVPSDTEWYAYSALWLAYGGALLALGLRLDSTALRSASLSVILATVLKVFIFDMSTLTGLLRVASFLGLGLALMLIGWIHQTTLKPLRTKTSEPADVNINPSPSE